MRLIDIEEDTFKDWLKASKPRPVALIGMGNTATTLAGDRVDTGEKDDAGWGEYCDAFSTLTHVFDCARYGAFGLLSVAHQWLGGYYYSLPEEHVLFRNPAKPRPKELDEAWSAFQLAGHTSAREPEEAVALALKAKAVDHRFRFPKNPDHVLRIAASGVVSNIHKSVAEHLAVKDAVTRALVTPALGTREKPARFLSESEEKALQAFPYLQHLHKLGLEMP